MTVVTVEPIVIWIIAWSETPIATFWAVHAFPLKAFGAGAKGINNATEFRHTYSPPTLVFDVHGIGFVYIGRPSQQSSHQTSLQSGHLMKGWILQQSFISYSSSYLLSSIDQVHTHSRSIYTPHSKRKVHIHRIRSRPPHNRNTSYCYNYGKPYRDVLDNRDSYVPRKSGFDFYAADTAPPNLWDIVIGADSPLTSTTSSHPIYRAAKFIHWSQSRSFLSLDESNNRDRRASLHRRRLASLSIEDIVSFWYLPR